MTPKQRKQLAQILLKEGEDGWRVERQCPNLWRENDSDHTIDCNLWRYRAIRTERVTTRTPLPIEHYKAGMLVKLNSGVQAVVLRRMGVTVFMWESEHQTGYGSTHYTELRDIAHWRWPNETEWKPAFTETVEERVVQTLTVEGL